MTTLEILAPVGNGAVTDIELELPYTARITVEGVCPILFHRWDNEAVEQKAAAKKGSAAKKTDNLESYVYRTADGELAIPGEYFRMALVGAARYQQDPRSPRKSAMDLFKASIVPLGEYCSLGVKDWDYVDRRRVVVQRSAITRARPAMASWKTSVDLLVNSPEYITPAKLNEAMQMAGRLIGISDFRPTYGRFQVVGFELI